MTCSLCGQEEGAATGCVDRTLIFSEETTGQVVEEPPAGERMTPLAHGDEPAYESGSIEPDDTCVNCEVAIGEYHHPGCDFEMCPNCGEQLLFCGCSPDIVLS